MENHTAKHFVLQLGSLVSLYLSISFLLVLLFGVITLSFPDPADGYYVAESAASNVRLGIAMVIVFFPTYLILTRIVNKIRRSEGATTYLGLTKWLIYLSLLIGGIVLLGDLVAVIMAFLEGELTQRFLLKALAVLFVVGAGFHYYLLDAKGYWLSREDKSIFYAIGMSLVVLVSLIYGFTAIDTPTAVREQKLDQTQLFDLQNTQYQIEDYIVRTNRLPETLSDLEANGITLPTAPEGRDAYSYEKTAQGFTLCATFSKASEPGDFSSSMFVDETALIKNNSNWTHGAGRYCFERVVNLERLALPK